VSGTKLDDMVAAGLGEATRRQLAGETDRAISMLESVESMARPAKHPGLPFVLIQKAGWLRELGRSEQAKAALDEAESFCKTMPPEMAPIAGLRMEQGIVARQSGDLNKAERLLLDAQRQVKGTNLELPMMSDILANISSVFSDQGRMEDAQNALLQAIQYDLKTNDMRALSSTMNMLGLLYMEEGNSKTARLYLMKAKEIASEAGMVKELADATHNLSVLSDGEGKGGEANAGFLDALKSAEQSGRLPEIASAKTSLGILAARDGRFQDARDLFTEALKVHSDLHLAEFCVNDLINLAQNELSLGNPASASGHSQAALKMAQEDGQAQKMWAVHYLTAKTQAAMLKDAENPDPGILEDILASYAKAADAIEILRAGIGRPEERERLLVDKEMVYQEAMTLAGLLRRATLAWSFAERSRARSFLDSLGAERVGRQAEKNPLAARRAELTRQLLEVQDGSGPGAQALIDELRMVRSLIIAEAPAVAALTEAELPKIQDVAALIPPDSAIVEFFLGPGAYLTVFVLNEKGVAAMHTSDLGTFDLAGAVEQFRAEVQYGVPGEPTGSLLFAILFNPVWDAISPVGRLFIVPHRCLHYLPMSAIWFPSDGEGPKRLYLCQRFELSLVPSAAYFAHMVLASRPKVSMSNALVLGNPTLDLPASEAEAIAVAKLLGGTAVVGKLAVRECVLGLSTARSVIHIASHGIYYERDPLLSGVLLADGRLSVQDILDAKIPADLLTLNACLTGVSSQEPGDELVGLARAVLAAGVPSVITALWEVGDDPAREFFGRFYANLLGGLATDEALGHTQRTMIEDEKYAAPANWAPYLLLGDCR
jgi:CHAT domain-containing protein/tetratricopeptide (TPR) repeat protein